MDYLHQTSKIGKHRVIFKADRYGAGFNSIIQNKEHGYGGINIAQDIVVGNVHTNPELLEEKK